MADSRNKRRAERIREDVQITDVLSGLGYAVRGGGREEQFACDLHGDGRDTRPSARVYPASNSWYCFACAKSRDAVETVREKKGIGFVEALDWIEKEHGLSPLPWEESDRRLPVSEEIAAKLAPGRTFEDDLRAFDPMMDAVVADRTLPMDACLAFWEARDKLAWLVSEKAVEDAVARATLVGLRDKVLAAVKEAARA